MRGSGYSAWVSARFFRLVQFFSWVSQEIYICLNREKVISCETHDFLKKNNRLTFSVFFNDSFSDSFSDSHLDPVLFRERVAGRGLNQDQRLICDQDLDLFLNSTQSDSFFFIRLTITTKKAQNKIVNKKKNRATFFWVSARKFRLDQFFFHGFRR